MRCCVKNCKGKTRFTFPKNQELKEKWLNAIRRPSMTPKSWHGLCSQHFKNEDILTESVEGGYQTSRMRLKTNAVPKLFSWQELPSQNEQETDEQSSVKLFDAAEQQPSELDVQHDKYQENCLQMYEEVSSVEIKSEVEFETEEKISVFYQDEPVHTKEEIIEQPHICSKYNVDDYKDKPQQLQHFTGFKYETFMTIFYTMAPVMSHFEKLEKKVKVSVKNQLFLTLWKLRRATCYIELGEHFNTDNRSASEIFTTWITIMSQTWSIIDLWPNRQLIDFYMPYTFKNNFPRTRVTLDETEIEIDAPENPTLKQATFSTYKNSNTLKVMMGTTPGGLISYTSPAYGGSTSDRQIIERSGLTDKCEPGDVILADIGILVQDLFAPYNVEVKTSTPMVSGSLPHKVIDKDRKLSNHRVHVKRLTGLMKTFTILSKKLPSDLLPLSDEIISVCVMLSNFKENIIRTY